MIWQVKSNGILDKMFCIVEYAKMNENYVEFYLYQSKYKNIDLKVDVLETIPYTVTKGILICTELCTLI